MSALLTTHLSRTRHAHRAERRRDRAAEAAERLLVQAALLRSHPLACAAAVALGASERQAQAAVKLRWLDSDARNNAGLAYLGVEVLP